MAAKVIYNMIECIATKDTPQSASKLLAMLLESTVEKVESMALVYNDVVARVERAKKKGSKDEPEVIDFSFIEKSRPVNSATYAVEKFDDLTHGMCPGSLNERRLLKAHVVQNIVAYFVPFCMVSELSLGASRSWMLPLQTG